MGDLFQSTCPHCGQPITESVNETTFAAFWAKVPHKVNKAGSEKAWRKLGRADQQEAAQHVGAFYAWFAKTYPGASPLHPSTYLNNKRWQDEGVVKNDDSKVELAKWIEAGLKSSVPSVVEHARRMAERHGVNPRCGA